MRRTLILGICLLVVIAGCQPPKDARTYLIEGAELLYKSGGIGSYAAIEYVGFKRPPSLDNKDDAYVENMARKSIAKFEKALELNPRQHDAKFLLAVAYSRILSKERAQQYLEEYIDLEGKKELAYDMLCALYWEKGEFDKAKKVIDKFRYNFPDKIDHYYALLIENSLNMGDTEAAQRIGEKAVVDNPDNPVVYLLLATVYLKTGQVEKADRQFNQAILINPELAGQVDNIKKVFTLSEADIPTR